MSMSGRRVGGGSRLACAGLVLLVVTTLLAGEAARVPRLVNERVIFPAEDVSWIPTNRISSWLMARLSPDAAYLLYARLHQDEDRESGQGRSFHLMLRELATGKDTRIPVPAYSEGVESVHIRFDPFDPKGRRLVVTAIRGRRDTEVVIFDITKGVVTPTGIKGRFPLARFGRAGQKLIGVADRGLFIATLPALKQTKLTLPWPRAYPNSFCPAADVVCLYGVVPAPDRRSARQVIALYDLKTKTVIRDLPTHEKNSKLDDLETQWTPDGRYVCYYDLADGPETTIRGTRIWDRVAGNEKAFVIGTAPIGQGPEETFMVLVRTPGKDQRPILYDVATARSWDLGDTSMRVIHAAAGKLAYVRALPDGGKAVCVADIAMPGR